VGNYIKLNTEETLHNFKYKSIDLIYHNCQNQRNFPDENDSNTFYQSGKEGDLHDR
jgi:hypothetical protein